MLVSLVLATAVPAAASPLAGLHYLVGTWNCTYRAGAVRFTYAATYAYDLNGHTLRQSASWAGGGDEELLAYDGHRNNARSHLGDAVYAARNGALGWQNDHVSRHLLARRALTRFRSPKSRNLKRQGL